MKKGNSLTRALLLILFAVTVFSCSRDEDLVAPGKAAVATSWADITLTTFKEGFKNTPTYSSRSLGYMGVCMYECARYADPALKTLDGQLTGLSGLPAADPALEYHWPLVINAGQDALLRSLYPVQDLISDATLAKINAVYQKYRTTESAGLTQDVINRSDALGKSIAAAIYEWSKTDGGHEGFKRHFDPTYSFPAGPGYWVPPIAGQTVSQFPLHPTWGSNRRFVPANGMIGVPDMEDFSSTPGSPCYNYYMEVYQKNLVLTLPEKEIAAWWTDDPTETFSPPGHSYNIATIAIRKADLALPRAAEVYARVGMAVADAFINCWATKYTYHSARPSTFVRSFINNTWQQYWPEPPFPAFPSGHSSQASAAAEVLTQIFGNNFAFTDNSHEGARRFSMELKFQARSFSSFQAAAEESAYSRFLGGIHTKHDNEVGMVEGKKVGAGVNALQWR